jgi:uncharacterized protein YdaU (DUF1376 family)
VKGGKTPIHIQRFAPADLHADEHFKLLESRRAYMLMTFYRQFLDHSFMAGGDLPADARALAAAINMPTSDVRLAIDSLLGKLIFKSGDRLYQRRVKREVAKELKFRRQQAKLGKVGGEKAGRGRPLKQNRGSPLESIGPPSPTPTPAPSPLPTTDSPNGADSRAGGDRSNSSPPTPPASVARWALDHDPGNPVEVRLASRIAHLASLVAERDGDADALEILAAVSATAEGKSLDHIRGAPDKWLEPTLRACDKFESDLTGGD